MKRLLALLILLACAAAACIAPAYATNGTIYDNTSTGPMVVRIQIRLRELGYLNFKPTGSYRSMTVAAAKAFQVNYRDNGGYEMMVDGKIGPQSLELLFRYDAKRVSLGGVSIPSGPRADSVSITGSMTSWEAVKSMMSVGQIYTVTDCYTGKKFELVFAGGENHAEMEPADEEAVQSFSEICGSGYNYLKRPVVIAVGSQFIAASIQCWPHGSDTVGENGMEGHVCLFFDGSSSHVGNMPDVEHNENIKIASGL